jgi:uncharacterized membrane protein
MTRYPFLDWMRGLAILVMIECHTFNAFTNTGLRTGGPYILSQFVGGMAGPLFLFMAGMTFGFGIERLDARESGPYRRWLGALRRGGYVLRIAYLFRFCNWVLSLPKGDWHELTKVDILNCMGMAMILFSVSAVIPSGWRVRFAMAGALAISAVAPLINEIDWTRAPALIHDYIAPPNGTGRFPIFPYAAFLGFGLAAGIIVKRAAPGALDRLMQWSFLVGLTLIFTAQYFSNIPFSLYRHSSFWSDSPALVLIRLGVTLVLMAGAYLWTTYRPLPRWGWMQIIGKNSLMVYWVHVMLVYGDIFKRWKATLSIPQTALATVVLVALMVTMSVVWLRWKSRPFKGSAAYAAGTPGAST